MSGGQVNRVDGRVDRVGGRVNHVGGREAIMNVFIITIKIMGCTLYSEDYNYPHYKFDRS